MKYFLPNKGHINSHEVITEKENKASTNNRELSQGSNQIFKMMHENYSSRRGVPTQAGCGPSKFLKIHSPTCFKNAFAVVLCTK